MGNMPNKWVGRALSLLAGAGLAIVGYFAGREVGGALAYGFTFDWYRHAVSRAYPAGEVLLAVGLVAGISALLGVALVAGPTAMITRKRAEALRYSPPRYTSPTSLDVHAGRMLFALAVGIGLVAAMGGYVLLQTPLLQSGKAISALTPAGYQLLVAGAAAAGLGIAGAVTALTTFAGVVSGRIVKEAKKNLIARVSLFGMRNAKATVAVIVGLSLVAGYHAYTGINTSVDVADVLPRGDPNTDAAHNLTQKFKSSFTQQVTFQFHVLDYDNESQKRIYDNDAARYLEFRATEPDPGNITDEVYIRAQSEFIAFVLSQEPFVGSVGAPDFFKLINWTLAGGQSNQPTAGPESYSLPPSDSQQGALQYRAVESGVRNVSAVFAALDAVTSPNWTQTAILVTVDAKDSISTKEIGEAAEAIRAKWIEKTKSEPALYQVFGAENYPKFSVDLPLANAHASELTKHDFTVLLPIIGVFIALTLYIAFRSVTNVVITFSMLIVAVLWTFGMMSVMRIPLNTLNLAVVPLIMGVGIDYGIHMMNEYEEQRHEGRSSEEAWTYAGGGSALALFVGTLTTVSGLSIMIVSPSLLVAQLGLLSAIAIVSCLTLAILFVPALTTLLGAFRERRRSKPREYEPSRIMPTFATGISRGRWLVLGVLVIVSVAAIASGSTIRREAFGDPPRNWLPSDPLRQEHVRSIEGFYETGNDDVKANVIIFEGDLTDPQAHRYISGITSTLRANALAGTWTDANDQTHASRVIADTLKDLPFLINTYITVKDGVPGAAALLGGDALKGPLAPLGDPTPTNSNKAYPDTREEIKATLDAAYDSPLFQLAGIFVDHPTYEMAVTIFSVKAATYADAEDAWGEIQAAIAANEELRPPEMHAAFFGNTAINYLFVAKQVPWLGYMSIGTNIAVLFIVFAFTRNVRVTLLVGACNFLSSALWLGALTLPFIDIGLAISLTLPLIFIFAMGSDYALHLGLRCRKTGNTYRTFEGVGKGVMYSFITTLGSFIIFTQVSDLAARRSMTATAIAIAVVFVMTLCIVPIFFPVKKHQRKDALDRNVPVVETRKVATPMIALKTDGRGGPPR